MPRTNQDGRDLHLVVSWLCRRVLTKKEMAAALGVPPQTYGPQSQRDSFPTYEQLQRTADHFGLSARVLQIAFGRRGMEEVAQLDDDEVRQYCEQGGVVKGHAPRRDRPAL